ncbi:hypothetical protein THII_1172 [Thioploca ingrica]|uniref:Uncharacterized protein n=1 Tax=Thioploca ingrica TaxID=40754 RepID=A0A090AES4_9GAMM|nr:hypothetical protein THII_1172 [Thioploca ingrica]
MHRDYFNILLKTPLPGNGKLEKIVLCLDENEEKIFLERFFKATLILPVSQEIIERATQLRQQRKMSLEELDLRNPFSSK